MGWHTNISVQLNLDHVFHLMVACDNAFFFSFVFLSGIEKGRGLSWLLNKPLACLGCCP